MQSSRRVLATRRDLPIPASPEINTTWPWPSHASRWRDSANAISVLRPTKPIERAVRTASKRFSDAAPPSTAQTAIGSLIPLTSRRPRLRKVNRSPSSARVEAATTTAPGSARLWSRAATFGASPIVACCSDASPLTRSPTTTSPVAMAIRTSTRSCARSVLIAAMMSRPARTARSASSSCARG